SAIFCKLVALNPVGSEQTWPPDETEIVVSNFTTISVSSGGQVCSDPTGFSATNLQKIAEGGKLKAGVITLSHTTTLTAPTTTGIGSSPMAVTGSRDAIKEEDSAVALFFGYDVGIFKSQ